MLIHHFMLKAKSYDFAFLHVGFTIKSVDLKIGIKRFEQRFFRYQFFLLILIHAVALLLKYKLSDTALDVFVIHLWQWHIV